MDTDTAATASPFVRMGQLDSSNRWKQLYADELEKHPKLAALLETDPIRLLEIAKLSTDEKEAWLLRGKMAEAEIATIMRRQARTVSELIRRAEYKLKATFGEGPSK